MTPGRRARCESQCDACNINSNHDDAKPRISQWTSQPQKLERQVFIITKVLRRRVGYSRPTLAIWTRMRSNGMITTTNVKYSLLARLEEGKSLVGSSKTGSKTRKRAECARAHASVRTTNATARVLNAPLHRMPPARIVYISASCPSPQVFRLLPYIKDLLP
ncbi:hypothetical protein EDD18DRAFT_1368805 [Armillaria luteobubalina]|uniref:Uncharacterized protein n=1 Tax=Armillaria luteobubalina TaxID=153913 RepID=A0AA39TX21_9AGAR|nr:hypothetical protein EDD18DRAFT_1370150 [Armillaria luteobubalina]KAK0473512.1 hypothetical protein EDD18DRAFT_1368805 [Armillaria luteobubalina]